MWVKKISKSFIHSSSEGISGGGIRTVEPDPDVFAGSLTSYSSKAGASARFFFCCDI